MSDDARDASHDASRDKRDTLGKNKLHNQTKERTSQADEDSRGIKVRHHDKRPILYIHAGQEAERTEAERDDHSDYGGAAQRPCPEEPRKQSKDQSVNVEFASVMEGRQAIVKHFKAGGRGVARCIFGEVFLGLG